MDRSTFFITDFLDEYPNDYACLEMLFSLRFGQDFVCPSCQRATHWYRIRSAQAYSCKWCGHHLHPTAGTAFQGARVPLQTWFYAVYRFTTRPNGVTAKELQRELGVTYKTAWRMATLIRQHMPAARPLRSRSE
jgi:transposase